MIDGMIIDVVQHEDVTDVIASHEPGTVGMRVRAASTKNTSTDADLPLATCLWSEGASPLAASLAGSPNLLSWLNTAFVPFGLEPPVRQVSVQKKETSETMRTSETMKLL